MAIKQWTVALGVLPGAPTEATNTTAAEKTAASAAVTTALAVSGLDGVSGATAAVTAIGTAITAIGTSLGSANVTVLIDTGSSTAPTKTNIRAALNAIREAINRSDQFAT